MAEISVWLKSFVMVTDAGSFSSAGVRLNCSQSTVSKHVAALEAHLGTRLFNRTTRSLTLTTDGALAYENALRVLGAIEETESSVGLTGVAEGIVRLTAPLTLIEARLIAMLAPFLEANPKIEVEFSASDHALNLVADNLDLGIRVGQLTDSRLIARRIGSARRVMVASPAYLDRAGRPAAPVDLARFNCLAYSLLGTGTRWTFTDGSSVDISGNLRADSPNVLRAGALAGIGIAVNAWWLFERDLASGALEIVLPDYEPSPMPIHILLPHGRYVAARTRALADHLASAFAHDPLTALA